MNAKSHRDSTIVNNWNETLRLSDFTIEHLFEISDVRWMSSAVKSKV